MRSLQSAFEFARLARGDAYIEPVHWLAQILRSRRHRSTAPWWTVSLRPRTASPRISSAALGTAPRGCLVALDFSRDLELLIERGWISASLLFGASRIRTGHLLHGMLEQPELKRLLHRYLARLPRSRRRRAGAALPGADRGSSEDAAASAAGEPHRSRRCAGRRRGRKRPRPLHDRPHRRRRAPASSIPCSAATREIREVVDILMRRRQNNPIIVGEAGVGKTALVEGLALRIAAGDVPPLLRTSACCARSRRRCRRAPRSRASSRPVSSR